MQEMKKRDQRSVHLWWIWWYSALSTTWLSKFLLLKVVPETVCLMSYMRFILLNSW